MTQRLIDLADAKAYLRVLDDDGDFDAEIERAIDAASAFLNVDDDGFGGLGFPIVAESWIVRDRGFTSDVLSLPFQRVTAVESVAYTDAQGVAQTMPAEDYLLTKRGRRFCLVPMPGKCWPGVGTAPDAVRITFTAGFANVEAVPDDIKAAARLLIGHFYENRLAVGDAAMSREIALGVDRLTARYRRICV
ncbi:head-tail connector protein [Roseovarius sp. MMSF_3350]|uniref:head-tail connector protein n=1 Tax=Roseovarius sp. MMSF_3350 TaxID=3046706 RepID=UPI00273F13B3|nr:head-tail connector protein [Roseovarius sp. MMSF_3350]